MFRELHPELNIGPCGPMATGVFFKPIKLLKPKSKNHDNGHINIQYAFDMIALISSYNNS